MQVEARAVTTDQARAQLLARVQFLELCRGDPELVGPGRTRERIRVANLERDHLAHQLELIAALPDPDLAWLLSMGWTPASHSGQ